ncbi:hypothetical protein GQ53DRAFT_771594 [Thozetella sp. PMI_491]|nr:hypothetical protein GQ53DRAFT_771594 [Thozetella sp. PMI_491]
MLSLSCLSCLAHHRIRSWVNTKAHGGTHRSSRRPDSNPDPNILPLSNSPTTSSGRSNALPVEDPSITSTNHATHSSTGGPRRQASAHTGSDDNMGARSSPPPPLSPQVAEPRPVVEPGGVDEKQPQKPPRNVLAGAYDTGKKVLLHSKLNLLLVFVPVGIAVAQVSGLNPGIIFAMNAIAIIPLAGLLSHATESVACKLGDSLGALLNVTFGNAVELIIFIALVKGEIRIVQASLLGSILANLLLILGMSFLLGGLRFREQIYNSTVTQMSACLLSLSVISLVLPTAFHASFNDPNLADARSLMISRGTSVILLLVYIIYLLFQLKSHAYMYESTPQHIIDEEATPGPVANWLDSSSDSSSSSDSDSDDSDHSRDTMGKRVKRRLRKAGRRRKSSVISMDNSETIAPTRTPSFGTADISPGADKGSDESSSRPRLLFPKIPSQDSNEEAVEDDTNGSKRRRRHSSKKSKKHKKRSHHHASQEFLEETIQETPEAQASHEFALGAPRRVDFAIADATHLDDFTADSAARRPFTGLRNMSFRPVAKSLAPTVFVQPPDTVVAPIPAGPVPRVRYGIRRTNSLPDRLNQMYRAPGAMMPSQIPLAAIASGQLAKEEKSEERDDHLTKTSAIILLLVSTALVAVCAEFMVDSIQGLVKTSTVGEIFIGLIILPIVGNAAEHVTAITVAMKNKMDLAIGVAVGSSIQIALFITPLVVILGWIMDRAMTLHFTLFETVCLFVSTFIVNFLVLDGRSNYLEGALLCATYVIISVVAFFYPSADEASQWGSPGT